jgi:single-strand DNA-binding protein
MFQKITLIGNLGRDPDMRYMPDGSPVTQFSLAVNRKWNGSDGNQMQETTWFAVSVFGKTGEACNQYLAKGSKVFLEGRLKPGENGMPRLWQRQDGTMAASYEMVASTVRFLDGREDKPSHEHESGDLMSDENIPF